MKRMARVLAMAVLCWTLPNSQPLIYTGQEVGYNHRFEFFEKDPMPDWHHNATTDFYTYLNEVKHAHPALDSDNPSFEVLSYTDSALVFKRAFGPGQRDRQRSVAGSVELEYNCPGVKGFARGAAELVGGHEDPSPADDPRRWHRRL